MPDNARSKPGIKINLAPERYRSAFVLMAFGMLTIPVMDVVAKALTTNGMPGTQVALARFIGQGLFTLALLPLSILFLPTTLQNASYSKEQSTVEITFADLWIALTWTNLARGFSLAGATACFFTGLATLPLPASAAILFLAPLLLTLLSGVFLNEPLTARKVGLCLAGFPCVLLIVRPGYDGLGWDALYPLVAAFLFAAYFLFTRLASGQGSPLAMHIVAAKSGAVVLAFWVYAETAILQNAEIVWPINTAEWVALASLGLISTIAHVAIIVAFARAPASELAPLNYLEIVSATVLSFAVFGTLPDVWTVLGALLIIAVSYAAVWPERSA